MNIIDTKIDLVYLWVDGSDENWLAKKNAALVKAGIPPEKSSTSDKRWRDNDELKYSLRSTQKFAPWINHIFIVTDEQIPKWLDMNNSKITIVDHKQIIPNDKLPVFNSVAIELFLWNIPSLSEYFLYANDDTFFGKPIKPSFFFDKDGNPITIFKERYHKHSRYRKTQWNALQIVRKHFGAVYNIAFKHAIEPKRKSYMADNAKSFYNDIIAPTATPFRDTRNIQRMVFPLLDNAAERNTIVLNWRVSGKRIIYDHKKDSTARRTCRTLLWLFATIFGFVKYDCYDKMWRITSFIKKYRPALFCLNDSGKNSEIKTKLLNEMFPDKSEFEK
jgi:hypothetical protein